MAATWVKITDLFWVHHIYCSEWLPIVDANLCLGAAGLLLIVCSENVENCDCMSVNKANKCIKAFYYDIRRGVLRGVNPN